MSRTIATMTSSKTQTPTVTTTDVTPVNSHTRRDTCKVLPLIGVTACLTENMSVGTQTPTVWTL